jgi:hypothetical protein
LGVVCEHVLWTAAVAVVRQQGGSPAIGIPMITLTNDVTPRTLKLALESLDIACRDLDDAVLAMPNATGDNIMVSSSLVGLLLRVMTARRHVSVLERGDAGQTTLSS